MFDITWHVDEEEWADAAVTAQMHAPGSPLDVGHYVLDERWLFGGVRFTDGGIAYPVQPAPEDWVTVEGRRHAEGRLQRRGAPGATPLAGGFDLSPFTFGFMMATAIGPSDFAYTRQADGFRFYETLDPLQVWFIYDGPSVVIRAWGPDLFLWQILVPTNELRPEIERFLRFLAQAIAERIPAFVEWESFQPIMAWR